MVINLFHSWRQHSLDKCSKTLTIISFPYIAFDASLGRTFADKVKYTLFSPRTVRIPLSRTICPSALPLFEGREEE